MHKGRSLVLASAFAIVGFSAQAADLPVKAPVAPAPVYAPYSWTGFYIGGNVGYSWAKHHIDITSTGGTTLSSGNPDPQGAIGGGQIGYNWQTGNWVLGLEADIQAADQHGDFNSSFTVLGVPTSQATSEKLDWFGTVRGRLGYAWDRSLLYATGGWAYGHEKCCAIVTAGGVTTVSHFSEHYSDGWTVGAGYEYAFADRLSARIEYLYVDFGSDSAVALTVAGLPFTYNHLTDNILRVGLNYKIW